MYQNSLKEKITLNNQNFFVKGLMTLLAEYYPMAFVTI